MLPQLIMPQLQLMERLRFTLMRFPPTPTPTLFLMTTQRLTSKLRRPPMVPAMSRDLTLLLFPRIQHVGYTSDGYNGYVADVTYEGTAQYPEYVPTAPAYKAAPAYHA